MGDEEKADHWALLRQQTILARFVELALKSEGAGPALAAHSKDASTLGQSPASTASSKARPANHEGEAIARPIEQASDTIRDQPLVSAGILIAAGIVIGKLLSRR